MGPVPRPLLVGVWEGVTDGILDPEKIEDGVTVVKTVDSVATWRVDVGVSEVEGVVCTSTGVEFIVGSVVDRELRVLSVAKELLAVGATGVTTGPILVEVVVCKIGG